MKSVLDWIFKQKDIDAQIISLMIAVALSGFIQDLSTGLIDPLVNGTFKTNKNDVQRVGPYNFKLQFILIGLIRVLLVLFIVYHFARLTKNF